MKISSRKEEESENDELQKLKSLACIGKVFFAVTLNPEFKNETWI